MNKTQIKYPPNLKAISIHAPHAYAICLGIKNAEYRTQATKRRGWVLIHSSQSKTSDEFFFDYGIDISIAKRGAIIGAANITDCTWDWEFECYAYHVHNPIYFKQPIEKVKGCQAIFWGPKTEDKKVAFTLASQQIRNHLLNK